MSTLPSSTGGNEPKRSWWTRSGLAVRIAVSAMVVGLGLALVFAVLFLAITGLRQRSLEARHSQQVIATANRLQTLVIDLETGVRGFAITGDRSDLLPWSRAQRHYPAAIKSLDEVTRDNPTQHRRALAIKRAINTYLSDYSRPLVRFMLRNPNLVGPIVVQDVRRAAPRIRAIRDEFSQFLSAE